MRQTLLNSTWASTILLIGLLFITSCQDTAPIEPVQANPDLNEDGKLNILILGTSQSIKNGVGAFAPGVVATELERILTQDANLSLEMNIVSEDIYTSKMVAYGLGQGGTVYNSNHYSHSLTQYYYWPENQTTRWDNLTGDGTQKWDYVVIAADPYIVAKTPGYYALGVNKIAKKVAEGGAKPLLLMMWPKDELATASIAHFSEYTYRTADAAAVSVEIIPAARAWEALPAAQKDASTAHPTPNGAYLTAASIYSHLMDKSAAASNYTYDDEIAKVAQTTKTSEDGHVPYTNDPSFISPFKSCDITDNTLNYKHTGTSSENGIRNGLNWMIGQSNRTLVSGGTPPINFNYGRANTNFEPQKRYNIDPAQFDFSFGFPMQDNGNHGDVSMLYGLDKRISEIENGTDLGVAFYMVRNAELPNGRAIPIRTLYAQLKEAIPTFSAYSDPWHMHGTLDKATGAFMYTMLTGACDLGTEPIDQSSTAWKEWMAHKIGYETAYTLMYLKGNPPSCN